MAHCQYFYKNLYIQRSIPCDSNRIWGEEASKLKKQQLKWEWKSILQNNVLYILCNQQCRDATKHLPTVRFCWKLSFQLHVGFDHAHVGWVCQSWGSGSGSGAALNPLLGFGFKSIWSVWIRLFWRLSNLTHLKLKKLITKVMKNYYKYSLSFARNNFFLRSYKI